MEQPAVVTSGNVERKTKRMQCKYFSESNFINIYRHHIVDYIFQSALIDFEYLFKFIRFSTRRYHHYKGAVLCCNGESGSFIPTFLK